MQNIVAIMSEHFFSKNAGELCLIQGRRCIQFAWCNGTRVRKFSTLARLIFTIYCYGFLIAPHRVHHGKFRASFAHAKSPYLE